MCNRRKGGTFVFIAGTSTVRVYVSYPFLLRTRTRKKKKERGRETERNAFLTSIYYTSKSHSYVMTFAILKDYFPMRAQTVKIKFIIDIKFSARAEIKFTMWKWNPLPRIAKATAEKCRDTSNSEILRNDQCSFTSARHGRNDLAILRHLPCLDSRNFIRPSRTSHLPS